MSTPDELTIRAYAKVNLALAVGPPTPPRGYHPIASWFACIDLHDELALARCDRGGTTWTIRWADDAPRPTPIDWPIEKDLAVRAHRLLEDAVGRELPLRAILTKRTPVGAGLGGGSADAAAAFIGIDRLFSLGLPRSRVRELSSTLGSDIAFFIDDEPAEPARPAIVTGFGERAERLPRQSGSLVLIFPPFGCPTGPVYQAFDRTFAGPLREQAVRQLVAAGVNAAAPCLFNDLAAPACTVEPRLGEILLRLRQGIEAPAHVTGSGSTIFLPAKDPGHAQTICREARRLCPESVALVANWR